MSKYTENNLRKDEQVILKGKKSIFNAMPQIVWAIFMIVVMIVANANIGKIESDGTAQIQLIVTVICLVIGLLPLLVKLLKLLFTDIAVTNKRVIGKTGVIRMESTDLPINKVDNVNIKATFWGRIFRYYTLIITGSGVAKGVAYQGIVNANQLKNAITDAIEKNAEEARKAQAAEIAMAMSKAKN